jgi:outer membrane lipoprotein-sorting protein
MTLYMRDRMQGLKGATAVFVVILAVVGIAIGADHESETALHQWLDAQSEIRTWSADVVQTRSLKSLAKPLKADGKVWFDGPSRFRWQLGDPPRTVAIRTSDELQVIYPRLKQIETYPFSGDLDPAWQQVLELLEVGFPSDEASFFNRYELLETVAVEDGWRFRLRPSSAAVRRMLEEVDIEVAGEDFRLLATELVFPDGSTMRNDFSGHSLNQPIDPSLFVIETDGDGWQEVRPLEGRR